MNDLNKFQDDAREYWDRIHKLQDAGVFLIANEEINHGDFLIIEKGLVRKLHTNDLSESKKREYIKYAKFK